MANTKEIQKRMKSIQDTMKITNAMYMISSSKLRNAKQRLEDTEPYFYSLQNNDVQALPQQKAYAAPAWKESLPQASQYCDCKHRPVPCPP